MTSDQIKELRRLAEVATPGPWHSPGLGEIHMSSHDSVAQICFQHDLADDDEQFGTQADADFIAAANPAAILSLLARIEALEQDAARYRWLRNQAPETIDDLGRLKTVDEFGAAIDTAIAQQDKGKETV